MTLRGLEAGEELRSRARASFRGATAASTRATLAFGSARIRQRAYEAWRAGAEAVGVPSAGPEMALGLTDRRVVVCRTSFWAGRPTDVVGGIPLARIAQVATVRHGPVTSLAIALTGGQVVEFEAVRGARLRRFAAALRAAVGDAGA